MLILSLWCAYEQNRIEISQADKTQDRPYQGTPELDSLQQVGIITQKKQFCKIKCLRTKEGSRAAYFFPFILRNKNHMYQNCGFYMTKESTRKKHIKERHVKIKHNLKTIAVKQMST